MCASKLAPTANAAANADTAAVTPSNPRPDVFRLQQLQGSVNNCTGGIGMSDAMRNIVWITGVAFGAVAPGVFAQSVPVEGTKQVNSVVQKLDTNYDGFISREEAKQNKGVDAAFSQADTSKDGELDEDELIKALSISQRETVAKVAGEGGSAARQYAVDSEITVKVKAALLGEEGLRSLEVSVQTYKGKVQLAGFVDGKEQIDQAGKIAARESGVKSVLNNLALK